MSAFLSKGLKVFVYYLSVLSLCRLIFCLCLQEYWSVGTGWLELGTAILLGTRLSIQTAGVLMLVTMLPAGLAYIFSGWLGRILEKILSGVVLTLTSILFVASFPYYRQFHSRFNQLMFNAPNDDMYALLLSMVQEFYLPVRLVGAFLLAFALWWLLQKILREKAQKVHHIFAQKESMGKRCGKLVAWLAVLYVLGRFIVFGGSWGWETALDWENVGVTNDAFLNEAILDDYQAVYRAYRLNSRFLACNGLNFTVPYIRELAGELSGRGAVSDNLADYLRKNAQGAQIAQPQHIFLIVSESYANWPLLAKYSDLHIADGMKQVIGEADSDYCPTMLPNGSSTVSALTGVTTGLADANLYLTTMSQSFAEPYLTAVAPQMQALGYETNFWYAGPASWERIESFVRAQGFAHFYGRGDMLAGAEGSVWGCDDEHLYATVLAKLPAAQPSFNVILNVSNHSPYRVDLQKKGFDAAKLRKALPKSAQDDDDLINALGHYWYADRELANFVGKLEQQYPDCLIFIVGDHADRCNIDKTPSLYERYAVPFIVTGSGVHKGLFLPDCAGSQIDIAPTMIEMVAPQGFTYYSIGASLTRSNRQGENYGFWLTRDYIGATDKNPLEPIALPDGTGKAFDGVKMQRYIDAVRSISWWLPKHGLILDEARLEN